MRILPACPTCPVCTDQRTRMDVERAAELRERAKVRKG
jgi:hypothetical protein